MCAHLNDRGYGYDYDAGSYDAGSYDAGSYDADSHDAGSCYSDAGGFNEVSFDTV